MPKLSKADKYIRNKKATHHIKKNIDDKNGIKFIDTIEVIKKELGLSKERIESILNADISKIENEISYLGNFDIGDYSLSNERIDFILSLIKARIGLFKEML